MGMDAVKKEKRILIVEDDRSISGLIAYNLAKNSFNYCQVYDGFKAQDVLAKEFFDVVILDIMLPGIDGFRICKMIKENPAAFKTFVIIISAKGEPLDKIYGNLMGADYYLSKPFSVAKLMDIVNELSLMRDKSYPVRTD